MHYNSNKISYHPNKNINIVLIFIILIIASNLLLFKLNFLSIIGLTIYFLVFLNLINDIGTTIPIRSLAAGFATFQWIVAPILVYHVYPESDISNLFPLTVEEDIYVSYVVPPTFAYVLGIFYNYHIKRHKEIIAIKKLKLQAKQYTKVGHILIIIGILGQVLTSFVPTSVTQFFVFLGYCFYIGSLYIFLNQGRFRWIWIIICFAFLLIGSSFKGDFADTMSWMAFIFFTVALFSKYSFIKKLLIVLIGLFSILLLQSFKTEYRDAIKEESSISEKLNTMIDMGLNAFVELKFINNEELNAHNVSRFNHGWVISRVINHVPNYEPYANGATIIEAFESALIPRILSPNKISSEGLKYFSKYADFPFSDTSMNLGLLAEGYVNFGRYGCIIFMFLVGLLFNNLISLVYSKTYHYPSILLWVPFIFLYSIKAETDFHVMLNQNIKGAFVLVLLIFMFRRFFKLRL